MRHLGPFGCIKTVIFTENATLSKTGFVEFRPSKCEDLPNQALKTQFVQISASKMGDELTSLLAIFHKIEETGGQATLSVATNSGKTKIKFELVSSPTTSATSTSSLPTSSAALRPASGQRKRSRAARLKAKARAAAHQASLAAAAVTAPVQVPPPPPP